MTTKFTELLPTQVTPFKRFEETISRPVIKSGWKALDYYNAIFMNQPEWVTVLFKIRNMLVKPFGFSGSSTQMAIEPLADAVEVGDKAGFLTITQLSEKLIITFAEDKHMRMWICVDVRESSIDLITVVEPITRLGQLYLSAIIPFHKVIVSSTLKRAFNTKSIA